MLTGNLLVKVEAANEWLEQVAEAGQNIAPMMEALPWNILRALCDYHCPEYKGRPVEKKRVFDILNGVYYYCQTN